MASQKGGRHNGKRQEMGNMPFKATILSDFSGDFREVQREIIDRAEKNGYQDQCLFAIKIALEEALVNAIKHGNQMDRSKRVFISYRVAPDRFDIQIADEGKGFDPDDVPDPMAVENLERPCGRGLLLMRHYMSEVTFHPPGNRLSMSKVRNGTAVKKA